MNSIMDYLIWRGDVPFSLSPLNEVDGYLFSQFSAMDYSGIVEKEGFAVSLPEAAEAYDRLHKDEGDYLGVLCSPWSVPMLREAAKTQRFGGLRLAGYTATLDLDTAEQFAAITIGGLPDGGHFIAFRGTDDTIAGWKEDFLLGVEDTVQAQRSAAEYLLWAASRWDGPLYVGGHSKGGNLAVFAAAAVPEEVQSRIRMVYNYDGPGFLPEFAGTEGYRRIRTRLHSILPQNSLIGTLLQQDMERAVIVESHVFGPGAHDGITWEVLGTQFVRLPELSRFSRNFDEAMDEVLGAMDREHRRQFVEEFFEALGSTGAVTLTDLSANRIRQALSVTLSLRREPEVNEFVSEVVERIFRAYLEEAKAALPSLPRPNLPSLSELPLPAILRRKDDKK